MQCGLNSWVEDRRTTNVDRVRPWLQDIRIGHGSSERMDQANRLSKAREDALERLGVLTQRMHDIEALQEKAIREVSKMQLIYI